MKNDTTLVRMRSGDHLGDAKCRKRAPRSVEFNFFIKVARNEVKNASFAQRSAHREGKNMATGIDRTGRRAQATRADDDGRSNRPTPTHRFCHSAIFHPITPYNVWFFWVSRHRSIILAKKMETFSGRFWEIPGNVRKLELSKTLVDYKNALVFYQAVSGKSSWSFLTGEPNTNKEKQQQSISSSHF